MDHASSNPLKELTEKVAADLAAGATEAWLVFPQSKRFAFYGKEGRLAQTASAIDLADLFD
ncbi:MAG: hypothetical protein IT531_12720 [Burkholderiales bacterium]|nr:hypothetical protein [Burkholderiales bacterium]